jgi:hypothetical protein
MENTKETPEELFKKMFNYAKAPVSEKYGEFILIYVTFYINLRGSNARTGCRECKWRQKGGERERNLTF